MANDTVNFKFGVNGSMRMRETPSKTEYYLFNAFDQMKAYSDNGEKYGYYGYDDGGQRTYKMLLNLTEVQTNRVGGKDLYVDKYMLYPNGYININQDGNYTKHYYADAARIASKIGNGFMDTTNVHCISSSAVLDTEMKRELSELTGEVIESISNEFDTLRLQENTGNLEDALFYYHSNHLHSTKIITDIIGNVQQAILYTPFGTVISEYRQDWKMDTLPRYLFTGYEKDSESDLYYAEARYYSDVDMVFRGRDVLFEKYFYLSPYAYCGNNPIKYFDPTGEYYIKPPSNDYSKYQMKVTNYKWVNTVSNMTAIPILGYMYEGMLGVQRAKDPNFNATTADYVGLGLGLVGAGSAKLLFKLGKIGSLGKNILNAGTQMMSSMASALLNPDTRELEIEYMAIRSLENDGIGKVYSNSLNNLDEYTFSFNESYTKQIEKEIMSDKNITSQKDFNLEKEVIKKLAILKF